MEQVNRRRFLVCPTLLLGIGVPIIAYAQPRTLDVWPPAQHPNVSVVPECYSALRPVQHVIDASYGQDFGVLIRADYLPNQSPSPDPSLYGRFQGWGSNRYGQLACLSYPSTSPCMTNGEPNGLCKPAPPGVATGDIRLQRVSASWDHVLALTDDPAFASTRGLIAWGNNLHGTCNIPDFNAAPYFIDVSGNPPAKIVDLAAGEFINIVLFDNGKVAAWGYTRSCPMISRSSSTPTAMEAQGTPRSPPTTSSAS